MDMWDVADQTVRDFVTLGVKAADAYDSDTLGEFGFEEKEYITALNTVLVEHPGVFLAKGLLIRKR